MISLVIKRDELFSFLHNEFGFIIPLTYLQREMTMNESQVKSILGALMMAHTAKIVIPAVGISLGVILAGIGVFLLVKFCKARREEQGTSSGVTPGDKINFSETQSKLITSQEQETTAY